MPQWCWQRLFFEQSVVCIAQPTTNTRFISHKKTILHFMLLLHSSPLKVASPFTPKTWNLTCKQDTKLTGNSNKYNKIRVNAMEFEQVVYLWMCYPPDSQFGKITKLSYHLCLMNLFHSAKEEHRAGDATRPERVSAGNLQLVVSMILHCV